MTNSIVWDLEKIREMKSDTIFVMKSTKKLVKSQCYKWDIYVLSKSYVNLQSSEFGFLNQIQFDRRFIIKKFQFWQYNIEKMCSLVVFSSSVLIPKPFFAHSKKASNPTWAQFKSWVDKDAPPEVTMASSGWDPTVMAKAKTKKSLTVLSPFMTLFSILMRWES